MQLRIYEIKNMDYYEKKVIKNIKNITNFNYILEDGTQTICFMYQLKNKKYSLFDMDKYILNPKHDFTIEEEKN